MGETVNFLMDHELELSEKFLTTGYVIFDVEDIDALTQIRDVFVNLIKSNVEIVHEDSDELLNHFERYIDLENLNDIRVNLIQSANSVPWLRNSYFKLCRSMLETLVGNELAMQGRINLSIQLPDDDSSLLPVHADVWSGDSPFEVVVWLPLVNCYSTKSMFILPPKPAQEVHENLSKYIGKSSRELFKAIESKIEWINIPYGQVMIFNQNLPHGNCVNEEGETRWSLNCRFKSIFSPYGGKTLGEFFEPITVRAATRIGMEYRFSQHNTKGELDGP